EEHKKSNILTAAAVSWCEDGSGEDFEHSPFSLHSQSYAEHSMPFCSPLLLAFKGCAALAKGVHWPIGVQQH
ncbi:hypothetical protein, partial [Salmonella sp. s60732]|uniref:hypothetical protein n=1 Tax=Salmonella sp. s60732 TaxID=3160132 RepID=UPI0037545535